eukprot:scaffold145416_cov72-Phaeocystis_antarctica.AAC.2
MNAGLREGEAEAVRSHAAAHVRSAHVGGAHVGPHVGRHACGGRRTRAVGGVEARRALASLLVLVPRCHVARHATHGRRSHPVPRGVDEGERRCHHVLRSSGVRRVPWRRLDEGKAGAGGHAEGRRAAAGEAWPVALRQGPSMAVRQRDHGDGARVEHRAHHRVEWLARTRAGHRDLDLHAHHARVGQHVRRAVVLALAALARAQPARVAQCHAAPPLGRLGRATRVAVRRRRRLGLGLGGLRRRRRSRPRRLRALLARLRRSHAQSLEAAPG